MGINKDDYAFSGKGAISAIDSHETKGGDAEMSQEIK